MATRTEGPTELRLPAGASPSPSDLGASGEMPVLVVAGTTTEVAADLAVRLLPTLRAVVDLAADREIALVTGGTDAGVFHLLGLALSAAPRRPPLVVGVAPDELVVEPGDGPAAGRAAVDATLDVLVRVPGRRWGDETAVLSRVVTRLAGRQPSALLLVGGGEVSRAELVEHLARGRPVVSLTGSGRLADALGEGLARRGDPAPGDDLPALLATGDVTTAPIDRPRLVCRRLARVLGRRRRRWPRRRSAVRSVLPRLRYRPEPPPVPVPSAACREWPLLLARAAEAEAVVYPAFARCDVDARIEQNRHRWFTVLALAGSFLTTVFGALQAWLQSAVWPGVVVATLGGASSVLTTVARRQGTLRSFLDARTRAERLRSLYFAHLARPPAEDEQAAARGRHRLEQAVAALAWGDGLDPEPPPSEAPVEAATAAPPADQAVTAALAGSGAPPAGSGAGAGPGQGAGGHSPAGADGAAAAGAPAEWHRQFLDAYRRHRVEDQSVWYAQRAHDYERARRGVVTLSSLLMVLAALFGALGAADAGGRGTWAFLAATLAALATALTSFEAAIGLARYGRLYGEAHRALMVAAADAPIDADLEVDGDARVRAHVQRIERILGDEVDTWSHYARQPADSADGDEP